MFRAYQPRDLLTTLVTVIVLATVVIFAKIGCTNVANELMRSREITGYEGEMLDVGVIERGLICYSYQIEWQWRPENKPDEKPVRAQVVVTAHPAFFCSPRHQFMSMVPLAGSTAATIRIPGFWPSTTKHSRQDSE